MVQRVLGMAASIGVALNQLNCCRTVRQESLELLLLPMGRDALTNIFACCFIERRDNVQGTEPAEYV